MCKSWALFVSLMGLLTGVVRVMVALAAESKFTIGEIGLGIGFLLVLPAAIVDEVALRQKEKD